MAHRKFPARVLTPEGEKFAGDVEMVSTRTASGVVGILARHQPLLAILEPTELRLYRSENEIERFAQAEGYLQVADGEALILVEEAHRPDELDRATLEGRLREARARLERAEPGSEEHARARRAVERLEVFLEVAKEA
ncbi:ATP synthase F1 subunit epsilon [Thermoleophilum album]|uniref:ATP synthase epsilon chain n=1 Tax=Thermoleophilum album TaxID=29539 RepID=A0A1H6FKE2_THEAL|nr:ATP synthase F1 subunit epsilon [Thermoleophilum album]SEH10313.1 F-type H+-transporting ATPase subunit epsilon [Thermoleophilum album]